MTIPHAYIKALIICIASLCISIHPQNGLSNLTQKNVTSKMHEIMQVHAKYKKMSPLLAKRALDNFISFLDPSKTYFLKSEIEQWLEPSEQLLEQISYDFEKSKFPAFESIFDLIQRCIERRIHFERRLKDQSLPDHINPKELKPQQWAETEEALYNRLVVMQAAHEHAIANSTGESKERAFQRLQKHRLKNEELFLSKKQPQRQQLFCTYLLKALASSLDSHTMYFTPAEAQQFLISFQQSLVGIGVWLRDDLNGFTILKVVEGGPSAQALRVNDKIIAIDREPVIGMDENEVLDRMRGEKGTSVLITVARQMGNGDEPHTEIKEARIIRQEIVLQDARTSSSIESFGDGVVATLGLHSFYQDDESSSVVDLSKELAEIAAKNKVRGVILDLRSNPGGLLPQAVDVVGLFIKKGIVATIKDGNAHLKHLRDFDSEKVWDGPLVVLIDRQSASASEIVAQSLKDYGRAIIVGDDHSFGKGSFQIFTLASDAGTVDPQGECKVTGGLYYTTSGKTPQLVGVEPHIVIPGTLSFEEIGEAYTKYPLENQAIAPSFDDTLEDVPFYKRDRLRAIYQTNRQKPITLYQPYIEQLRKNSAQRIAANKGYQEFLSEVQTSKHSSCRYDFQGAEAINVMKDLLSLMQEENLRSQKAA